MKAVEENVVAKVDLVQKQLSKHEEQLERMTQQISDEVQAEKMKKGIAEDD